MGKIHRGGLIGGFDRLKESPIVYSGVWDLRQQGVAQKGDRWQQYVDMTGRAILGGGFYTDYSNVLEYVAIQTTGNSTDFGNLTQARYGICGSSSSTRGLKWQGMPHPGTIEGTQSIDFVTIATTGDASDFGDCAHLNRRCGALANDTRSVKAGGNGVNQDLMEYVTIASTGNTTSFGDLLDSTNNGNLGGGSNTTRGVYVGRFETDTGNDGDRIQYITIASTGNATDFGNLSLVSSSGASGNSSTRITFAGGYNFSNAATADIVYITTASTGNSSDFGDLTLARYFQSGASDKLRAVIGGGRNSGGTYVDNIDYITIGTTGNATDFGDLLAPRATWASTDISSTHGGLA